MAIGLERLDKGLMPHDLVVGMSLFYRGDDVPYEESQFLIRKGRKTGKWLLPCFKKNDAKPAGEEWMDIPGNKSGPYTIIEVVKNRKDKKTGADLGDLWHIRDNGSAPGWMIGLLAGDVCAKFGLIENPSHSASIDVLTQELPEYKDRVQWREKMILEGW